MLEFLESLFFVILLIMAVFIGIIIGMDKQKKKFAKYFDEIQEFLEREKWPF